MAEERKVRDLAEIFLMPWQKGLLTAQVRPYNPHCLLVSEQDIPHTMKRRMSAAEREALEAVARPIVGKYVERALQIEDTRRSAQSMLQLVQEVLQRGCMVQFSTTDSLRLSPTQQWMVGVEWVLQQVDVHLGPATRYVLVFRLSRTPKKEERLVRSDLTRHRSSVQAQWA